MKKLRRHPYPFFVLIYGGLWNTFSYFGIQMFIVLYVVHTFHLSRSDAYSIYGAYLSLLYLMPLLGGVIADKWLGSYRTFVIGAIVMVIGNLLLMIPNHSVFSLGVATMLIGTGLYKSNLVSLTGNLYQDGDMRKERAFTWLYLSVNIGGTLGPVTYGLVGRYIAWNLGFLVSAIGIISGLIWFVSKVKPFELLKHDQAVLAEKIGIDPIVFYVCLPIACVGLSVIFLFPAISSRVLIVLFAIAISYLARKIIKQKGQVRHRLIGLFILSFFATFYFAASAQTGALVPTLIEHSISSGKLHIGLPASSYGSLYTLAVLLLVPLFTWLWYKLSQHAINPFVTNKVSIGIILASVGMLAFALASILPFVLLWLIIGYLLLGAGELTLTPAIYTAISDYTMSGMKSTMMGCWFLFVALGGYLSSVVAKGTHVAISLLPSIPNPYSLQFSFIACFSILIAIILLIFNARIKRLFYG